MAAVDHEAVGKAFVEYYYNTFSSNRTALAPLYQDASMLTFEGQQFMGTQLIMTKLNNLTFKTCKFQPSSTDFQPSINGGVVVFVTGTLTTDGDHPQRFSQVFHLMPFNNNFVVTNDMFRLVLG